MIGGEWWGASSLLVYVAIGLLVLMTGLLWPFALHFRGDGDLLAGKAQFSVRGFLGRVAIEVDPARGGGWRAAVDARLLHFFPLRKVLGIGTGWNEGGLGNNGSGGAAASSSTGRHTAMDRVAARPANVIALAGQRWAAVVGGMRGIGEVLQRARVEKVRLRGAVGLGDAARTAVVYGLLWGLLGAGGGWLQRRLRLVGAPEVGLRPLFGPVMLRVGVEGRLRLRVVHLLAPTIGVWIHYRRGRRNR